MARAADPDYVATTRDRPRDMIPDNDYVPEAYKRGTFDMMPRNRVEAYVPEDVTIGTLRQPSYFGFPSPSPPPPTSPPSLRPPQDMLDPLKKVGKPAPMSPGQPHSERTGKMVARINPERREARNNTLDLLLERPLAGRGRGNDSKGTPGEHSALNSVAGLKRGAALMARPVC